MAGECRGARLRLGSAAASPSDLEVASSQSRRYDDELARRPLPAWEPPELIVGEPLTVWTEVRRPGPNSLGQICEGFYIVHDGRVHLSERARQSNPGLFGYRWSRSYGACAQAAS